MTQAFEHTAAAKLPDNPNAAMIEMMYIIDNFRGLMVREAEALESADARAFLELQDEKIEIGRRYETGMSDLLSRKEQIRAADPTLRQRLDAMQKNFHAVTERNLQGIERMKGGTQRLHEKIMLAARETAMNEKRFAYGANGAMQNSARASIGISEQA